MLFDDVAAQSRWVNRSLWLVAAGLALTIILVHGPGVSSRAQLAQTGQSPDASAAFRTSERPAAGLQSIDAISCQGHASTPVKASTATLVPADASCSIVGWAFAPADGAPYEAIGARIDRRAQVFSAVVHIARPDVAAAFKNPRVQDSGFLLPFDTMQLAPGRHDIDIRAQRSNGRPAGITAQPLAITVYRESPPVQNTDAIDALNGITVSAADSLRSPIVVLRSYRRLTVYGWGFVTAGKRLASNAALMLDGNVVAQATYGLPRPDVASAFHDVRVARSGLSGTMPLDTIPLGVHDIKIQLSTNDGMSVSSASTIRINVR